MQDQCSQLIGSGPGRVGIADDRAICLLQPQFDCSSPARQRGIDRVDSGKGASKIIANCRRFIVAGIAYQNQFVPAFQVS